MCGFGAIVVGSSGILATTDVTKLVTLVHWATTLVASLRRWKSQFGIDHNLACLCVFAWVVFDLRIVDVVQWVVGHYNNRLGPNGYLKGRIG